MERLRRLLLRVFFILLLVEMTFSQAFAASPGPFKSFASFVLYLKMHTQMITKSLLLLIVVLLCLIIWEILSWMSGRKKIPAEAEVHIVGGIAPDEDPFRSLMREANETHPSSPGGRPPEESIPLSPLSSAPPRHPIIETNLGRTKPLLPVEPLPPKLQEEKVVPLLNSHIETPQILTPSIEAPSTAPPPPRKERKPLNLNLNLVEEDPWKALLRTSQKENGPPSQPSAEEVPAASVAPFESEPALLPPAQGAAGSGQIPAMPETPVPEAPPHFPEPAVPRPALSLEVVPEKEKEPSRPKKLRSAEKDDRELRKKALELEETLKKVQSSKTENETKEGDM